MGNLLQINYITLGGFASEKPLPQAMAEARAMGYDGLEPVFGAGCLAPGVTQEECRRLRACADKTGLRLGTMATGSYWAAPFTHPRAAVRRQAVEFTENYLQVASWLGIDTVLVLPGAVAVPWDPSQPVVSYAQAWERATAGLKACLPAARRLGVRLAVENVWNWFLADPVAMRAFVDQFPAELVGVYFDAGNCLVNGYPEHWIEMLDRRIFAVHVKNFRRDDCGGTLHGFGDDLESGAADWPAVRRALRKIRYRGPVTAEMIPFSRLPDLRLPDLDLARDTAGKLRRLFG